MIILLIQDRWLNDNTPYKPTDIDKVLSIIKPVCKYVGDGKTKYLNIPVSFDIETTSFYDSNNEKTAIMYIWMLGICGLVVVGRTWEEWLYTYDRITKFFRTCGKRILVCYIHNLSFDFQFIRKHHTMEKVFATDKYQPLYARTVDGFEFRCSYRLSGYSLETLAKNLFHHKILKLKGDLDYRKIRHSQTTITDIEMGYCLNDAKIVNAYLDELIEREGDITKIPLTKTGFVRRNTRNDCFKDKNYKWIVQALTLSTDEFILSKNAFQGGFTHSNADITGKTLFDVMSMDICSSYPATLFDELFPMSKPKHIKITSMQDLKYYCSNFCCIFKITLNNIYPRYWYDFYISASKCEIHGKRLLSNGRIVSADTITTTITNVDYDIIQYMYIFDKNNVYIDDFIIFEREYLPTPFVKSLIEMYQKKTSLKGVKGKEVEYMVSKENQNSYYGMTVTSPIRDSIEYNGEWLDPVSPELNIAIDRYNNDYNRFLYYPWGVFCTAYARHNIWEAIINCGYDHCYCDTDSEKFINYENHKQFFIDYNNRVMEKHKRACKTHNIDISMVTPKTIDGKIKPLGYFEVDGIYKRFKTQGAKRYLVEKENGELEITVAGMNKKSGLEYLIKRYGKDIFDAFQDELVIPSNYSGRLVHTYIDDIREGDITDLNGVTAHYKELSCIHLEPTTYKMGISSEFEKFINNIIEGAFPWQS